MVLHLLRGKINSDCYYCEQDLGEIDMLKAAELAADKNIKLEPFEPTTFSKEADDYNINEATCSKRILAPDLNIYYCPGFVELGEPICALKDYNEATFNEQLEELYFKRLYMCTGSDLNDVRRFCPVKSRCDKKMCYYLNHKLTNDNRFPFNDFCIHKEVKYRNMLDTQKADVLGILLNCIIKQNEAILSLATANPNPVVKQRLGAIVQEVNDNVITILERTKGDIDAQNSG